MNLYAKELMDHYSSNKNRGMITNAHIETEEYNPSCGDKIKYFITLFDCNNKVIDKKILNISFIGSGCVVSQATASILADFVKNKDLQQLIDLSAHDIIKLIKIDLGPTRLKCALLPLYALQKGIAEYLKDK